MKITAETTDEKIKTEARKALNQAILDISNLTDDMKVVYGKAIKFSLETAIDLCSKREQAKLKNLHEGLEKEFAEKVKKLKKDLELIESSLYAINSQVVSLRWIGMDKNPTTDEIQGLNQALGGAIKGLRECREIFNSKPDGVEKPARKSIDN